MPQVSVFAGIRQRARAPLGTGDSAAEFGYSETVVGKSDGTDWEETMSVETRPALEATVPRRPYILEQLQGPGAPRKLLLLLPEVVVGRSSQAHVALDSNALSRRHVSLKRRAGEYTCTDLGSKNGFYVNGVRAHSAVLRDGDTLQLGDVVFVYREGEV